MWEPDDIIASMTPSERRIFRAMGGSPTRRPGNKPEWYKHKTLSEMSQAELNRIAKNSQSKHARAKKSKLALFTIKKRKLRRRLAA